MSAPIVEGAKVMSKGQITLPKDIREKLGVEAGDRLVLIWDNGQVVLMNAAVFALKKVQDAMKGAAEEAGFESEEDVAAYISDLRAESRNQ
ncbi:AbrB/MazE/SpoVT family DNA-binding domain-containing protein [Tessaracoccus caeni]|uniref:AbrB/MazE/SpoVT family DNA-binding domain-containing protein n=1 Tax=Tessaracoccus caeni TaxID=3031239 RepID=UPI0023DA42CC|nr:AbrB/MazE/SpoVT family DNA-binding domain-containing protein [Tessaracoccus caeni]MDF1487978.1 AbrB/MazE/SpoVT family DNA-binding domain-containing protein [Tessaracoccus caeni]